MTSAKEQFTIRVTYFKDTGKLYTCEALQLDCTALYPGGRNGPRTCYMADAVDHIERCRRAGTLPGLADGSNWELGYILVDCPDGYPCLLLPTIKEVT